MGFNLSRRYTPHVVSEQPVYTEKRLDEKNLNGEIVVSVVDCDLSHDSLPPYDSFPLEAQLASGVPLQAINPSVIVDNSPTSVAARVDKILTDNKPSTSTIPNNDNTNQ